MGNWFEEQAYWDAMEQRDGELDSANSIVANPLVVSSENYHTSSQAYGATIQKSDVQIDKTHCARSHSFEDEEKLAHQRESHQIFSDELHDMKYRQIKGPSMAPIAATIPVKIHKRPGIK